MATPAQQSYEKINYLIRPSKQVERKLFIEALHRLSKAGYNASDYTYLGFGSVFYADFILFHKYLYIDSMICVESSNIPKRMKFNKPYHFITLEMKPVSDVLPKLKAKRKYIVWLDYDCVLNSDILDDVNGFASFLAPGSVLILTVEAEPKLPDPVDNECLSKQEREAKLVALYNRDFEKHLRQTASRADFSTNELPKLLASILRSQLAKSLVSRSGLEFFQLFNFVYADGAQMLTLGGIIDKTSQQDHLKSCGIYNLHYIQAGLVPVRISVPPLTTREKLRLDQMIRQGLTTDELEFELDQQLLENYKEYYRHYPQYHEAII